jgi:hypothetical protein
MFCEDGFEFALRLRSIGHLHPGPVSALQREGAQDLAAAGVADKLNRLDVLDGNVVEPFFKADIVSACSHKTFKPCNMVHRTY